MAQRWDTATGVVTPEAVRLQFSEANVGSRAVAFLLDAFVLTMTLLAINAALGFLLVAGAQTLPSWVPITVLVIVNFLLFFGYPVACETLLGGRTPGKSAIGLRVVTVEGAPIGFRHAAIRAALGLVDFFLTFGVAAIAATLFSKRHQRLGDMVAGTVVLRERTAAPAPMASAFTVPVGAESYAVTLDPAGLSPRDYEAVRGFLLRANTLPPEVRADLGRTLARGLATKLSHVPPPSVSAELFLSCLAARYQERQWQAPAGAPLPAAPPVQRAPDEPTWGDFAPPT